MADVSTMAKNKAQEFGNSVTSAATTAADGVKNAAGYVADQAKDVAGSASKGISSASSYLDQKAEEATTAFGGSLKAAGDVIRHNVRQEGRLGQASSVVAQTLTDTGSYLEREGLDGIVADLTGIIKKNPLPALMIGIGLGFLVARASAPRR